MTDRRETKVLNVICVLCVLTAGVIRAFRERYPAVGNNSIIGFFYILAAFLWLVQVRRRLVQPQERTYLTGVALLVVFLTMLRTVKYIFVPDTHVLSRYIWYLYYVPQTFAVLFAFFAVLHIGLPYEQPICRAWKLLYIPAWLLVIGIMTNDLHELAFRFPNGLESWERGQYDHGILYVLAVVWLAGLFLAMLAVAFRRCAVSENRKRIWLPLVVLAARIGYLVLYFVFPESPVTDLFKTTELICFIVPAFLEALILARLFPSNDDYRSLWEASDLNAGIMDEQGRFRYRSAQSIPVTPEQVRQAQTEPVLLEGGGKVLGSHRISGGYGYWVRDLSEISRINGLLAETGDVMAEENAMLEGENRLAEKRLRLEQQKQLYDTISAETKPQLRAISGILDRQEKSVSEADMKHAAVLMAYVKRRSNLLLLHHQRRKISVGELRLALTESLDYLELSGVTVHGEYSGEELFDGRRILLVYEIFEAAIERAMPELAAVMINLETDALRQSARRKAEDSGRQGGKEPEHSGAMHGAAPDDGRIEKSLILRMEMSSSSFHGEACPIKQKTACLSPEFKKAELEKFGGSLSVEAEEGTEFLSVTVTEGGGEP